MNTISPEKFAQLVPSSRANQKPPKPEAKPYAISVQRRDKGGRFREVAQWTVITEEPDMAGPLSMGLKDNYRIVIREGKSFTEESSDDSRRPDSGGGEPPSAAE